MLPCSVDDDKSWANVSLYAAHENCKVRGELWRTSGSTSCSRQGKLDKVVEALLEFWEFLRVMISIYKWPLYFPQSPDSTDSFIFISYWTSGLCGCLPFCGLPTNFSPFLPLPKKGRNSTGVCKRNLERRRGEEVTGRGNSYKQQKQNCICEHFQLLPSSDHDVYLHGLDLCLP